MRQPKRFRTRTRRRDDGERGAALVEFALVSTLLFSILFGTIEFGFAFFQINDIRHGSREGSRLVAVSAAVSPSKTVSGMNELDLLAQATCERMSESDGAQVLIALVDTNGDSVVEVGDDAIVRIQRPLRQYTNLFDPFLGGVVLDETVRTRVERSPDHTNTSTKWNCL